MPIRYTVSGPECLDQYNRVPIRFTITRQLDVRLIDDGIGGIRLVETKVDPPWIKDYDEQELPSDWAKQFDMAHWRFFLAWEGETPVGAAALVWDTPGIHMLGRRRDLSVLWDIRIHPDYRGQGIGAALFTQAVDASRALGLEQMMIETQNINADACAFYRAMGCRLGAIHRFAYRFNPRVRDEAMLLWFLDL